MLRPLRGPEGCALMKGSCCCRRNEFLVKRRVWYPCLFSGPFLFDFCTDDAVCLLFAHHGLTQQEGPASTISSRLLMNHPECRTVTDTFFFINYLVCGILLLTDSISVSASLSTHCPWRTSRLPVRNKTLQAQDFEMSYNYASE